MNCIIKTAVAILIVIIIQQRELYPQTYNKPLTIEAFNRTTYSSAVSRSLGGLTLSSNNDASTMFSNPAGLMTLNGIQFSIGTIAEYRENEHNQRWYSLDWLSMFDLFIEGKTEDLRDPIIDTARVPFPTYQDSIQRNGRNPNWTNSSNQIIPPQVFLAAPFEISGIKFSAGIGFVEYANLTYYYENRTAFNRNLDYITLPISTNPNPVRADWWRDIHSREGSLYGYGAAFSVQLSQNFSVGISGMYISGDIKDRETRDGYGSVYFFSRDFRYTPDSYSLSWEGTSEVTSFDFTFSSIYRSENLILGITIKPPTEINRDFTTSGDSTYGTSIIQIPEVKGRDNITLPFRGSIGFAVIPGSNLIIGAEYEYNPYSSAEYSDINGAVTKPWLDCSSFHFGLQYQPIDLLSLRLGFQTKAEVFGAQGYQFNEDPVSYSVYSLGVGIHLLRNLALNMGYEYINMHYEDNWNLHSNINKKIRNSIFGSLSFTL